MAGPRIHRYLIALGSNIRHRRYGAPRAVLRAAFAALAGRGVEVVSASAICSTPPLGPSRRCYANAAALVRTDMSPPALLLACQAIEREFGRRRMGREWVARVLDLDIVLWSGGVWAESDLVIPHPHFRKRAFVLAPAREVCPGWRDPLTGLTVAQLHGRLTGPVPSPSCSVRA